MQNVIVQYLGAFLLAEAWIQDTNDVIDNQGLSSSEMLQSTSIARCCFQSCHLGLAAVRDEASVDTGSTQVTSRDRYAVLVPPWPMAPPEFRGTKLVLWLP